jgi:hypothetical protein
VIESDTKWWAVVPVGSELTDVDHNRGLVTFTAPDGAMFSVDVRSGTVTDIWAGSNSPPHTSGGCYHVRITHDWGDEPQVAVEVELDGVWQPYGTTDAAGDVGTWAGEVGGQEGLVRRGDWPNGEYTLRDGVMVPGWQHAAASAAVQPTSDTDRDR